MGDKRTVPGSQQSSGSVSGPSARLVPDRRISAAILTLTLALVLASTFIGRAFTAVMPGPYDAQLYAYVGDQWAQGRLPYLDVWESKPPGIFLVNAIVFKFFPASFTALAVAEGIFILGFVGALVALLRLLEAPPWVTALGAVGASIAANLSAYNELGNVTEIYVLWPATLSIYCFWKAWPDLRGEWIFLAGLASGAASLFKPVGLAPFLAQALFLVLLLLWVRRFSARQVLESLATNAAGVLGAWLPLAVYFALHGGLGELFYASFTHNLAYGKAGQAELLDLLPFMMGQSMPLSALLLCAVAGALWFGIHAGRSRFWQGGEPRKATLLFFAPLAYAWLAFDLAGVLAGGRGYGHYLLCLIPSLVVAAVLGAWKLFDLTPVRGRRVLVAVAFAIVLTPLVMAQIQDVESLRQLSGDWPDRSQDAVQQVIARLEAEKRPGDTLFVWDYLPAIHFATGMPSPTRLPQAHHIFDEFSRGALLPEGGQLTGEIYDRLGGELIRQLDARNPTFLVDGAPEPDRRALSEPIYREFRRLIATRYRQLPVAGPLRLYALRSSPTRGN